MKLKTRFFVFSFILFGILNFQVIKCAAPARVKMPTPWKLEQYELSEKIRTEERAIALQEAFLFPLDYATFKLCSGIVSNALKEESEHLGNLLVNLTKSKQPKQEQPKQPTIIKPTNYSKVCEVRFKEPVALRTIDNKKCGCMEYVLGAEQRYALFLYSFSRAHKCNEALMAKSTNASSNTND